MPHFSAKITDLGSRLNASVGDRFHMESGLIILTRQKFSSVKIHLQTVCDFLYLKISHLMIAILAVNFAVHKWRKVN